MTKEKVLKVLKEFFADTSRSQVETREALEEIRDELEIMIESLT